MQMILMRMVIGKPGGQAARRLGSRKSYSLLVIRKESEEVGKPGG